MGRPRLLVTTDFMPKGGGIQSLLHRRIQGYGSEDLCVLAPNMAGAQDFDAHEPYPVIRSLALDEQHSWSWKLFSALVMLGHLVLVVAQRGIKVIECGQAFPFPPLACFLKRVMGVKTVITYVHGNDVLLSTKIPVVRRLALWGLRHSDVLVANSRYTQGLLEALGLDTSRMYRISPVVDPKVFSPGPKPQEWVAKLKLEGKQVILGMGRLVERKGFDTVICALPHILKSHPQAVYVLVGGGPYEATLRALVKEHGVGDQVRFVGEIDNEAVPKMYRLADVFCMVSRTLAQKSSTEGLGLVYLEAGATGLPLVAGNEGGVTDIIENGVNGRVVDPRSEQAVAQAISELLSQPQLRYEMGLQSIHRFTRAPDWSFLDVTETDEHRLQSCSDSPGPSAGEKQSQSRA